MFNPRIHHRRSIRLKGYDYRSAGAYFVTICAQNHKCLFGTIINGVMQLNEAGEMICRWYNELSHKFPDIECDEFQCMPNHIHFIVVNTGHPHTNPVRADLRVCPNACAAANVPPNIGTDANDHPNVCADPHVQPTTIPDPSTRITPPNPHNTQNSFIHNDFQNIKTENKTDGFSVCPGNDKNKQETENATERCAGGGVDGRDVGVWRGVGQTQRSAPTAAPAGTTAGTTAGYTDGNNAIFGEHVGSPLSQVIQWFKTMTTNEYIRGVKQFGWARFDKRLLQRDYWEHIVRNEPELNRIRHYIANNPAKWESDKFHDRNGSSKRNDTVREPMAEYENEVWMV